DQAQVLCFLPAGAGTVWLGSGNPAGLYRMNRTFADSGELVVPPFDCGNPARFGRLDYRADVPEGTGLAFDTRSGNSSRPDSTWSDWEPVTGRINSPPARFIQWRVRLTTLFPNITPKLEGVDIFYEPANLAPVIGRLNVTAVPFSEAQRGITRPTREISWEVSDPQGDSLQFELFFKSEGDRQWKRLRSSLAESQFELDTRTLPDGWFRVKLVASDRPSHGPAQALSSELVSRPFLVDNTPPVVRGLRLAGSRVLWTASDELSPIVACRLAVNGGEWSAVEPLDSLFDAPNESFAVEVELATGENTVAVWVADGQGNVAVARITALR
ncbi:MAG: hypothetical protein ABIK44_03995, partial [candidate division WOR-3 bacterium]